MDPSENILGVDPGKGELNVALLRRGRVVRTERVVLPVEVVEDLQDRGTVKKLRRTVRDVFRRYQPDVLVLERMMLRPGRGSPVEVINLCLGFLLCLAPTSCKVHLVTAASWKNWLKKRVDVERYQTCAHCKRRPKCDHVGKVCLLWREAEPWQKLALEEILEHRFATVHEADAAGLAWYVRERWLSRGTDE